MFTCNDINLLTFTYYLKCMLVFNIIILPFLYLYINIIIIIKKKLIITKWLLKKKIKSSFLIVVLFCFSLIIHNMLNNNKNVCYVYATPSIYHQYKNSYNFLENKDIDSNLKSNYLNTILTSKSNSSLSNTIYKQAYIIIDNDNKEEKEIETENSNEQQITLIENEFLHENDINIQNSVYVIDGVFYYPNYIYGNSNTYSGMNCSSNPLGDGYNNPYGYNNYFYTRLTKFIDEASKNGYKITMSNQGCRSYSTQVNYYSWMESGRAARPGLSLHGFGIASDLEFYYSDGSICPYYRTDSNCPSMSWAHSNAYRFGLTFPLLNASYKEDWHIEPINKIKY